MSVRIVTDSTSDLSTQYASELAVTIVPVYVRFGETSYRDGVDINHDEFYKNLVNSSVNPTTSQPTPDDFAKVYRELSRETDEIVSIHVSSKLSGTYNSALQGKALAATKSNITIIDSKSVTMGLGIMAMSAARLASAGKSLAEILEDIKHAIDNTHLLGTFDTLKYLVRGGRLDKTKALLGSVLNIKPLITIRDGELVPAGNARTRAKAIEKLFEFVKNALNVKEAAVVHNTTPDEARSLRERLSSLVGSSRLHSAMLGPALGVHGGPGTLAVVFRNGSGTESKIETQRHIPKPSLHLPKLKLTHR
ncbi:MAG: DegV family protein [Dehalococcoidales bacterium]|nr:DegV family protein [Dehalococcoidales bacterium]